MKSRVMKLMVFLFGILACTPGGSGVMAQNFPSKVIRIVTASVGGGNDLTARPIAHGTSRTIGQQVVDENGAPFTVVNEPGARYVPDDGNTPVAIADLTVLLTMEVHLC